MVPLSLVHSVVRPTRTTARPPLLLLLHGVGSNERSMVRLAPAFDPRFLTVCARSPITVGPDAYAWFHVQFTAHGPVIDAAEAARGWAQVAAFAQEAAAAYGADPQRTYVAGFSQGGIMALAALLTSPERFAGAVVMSGRLLPEVLPHATSAERLRGKPLLQVHGLHDDKLGVHYARWAREQLAPLGLDLTWRELDLGHAVSNESLGIVANWLTARLDAKPGDATGSPA